MMKRLKILLLGEFPRAGNFGGSPITNVKILERLIQNEKMGCLACAPIFKGEKLLNLSLPIKFFPVRHLRNKAFGDPLVKLDFKRSIGSFLKKSGFKPDIIYNDNNPFLSVAYSSIPQILSLHGSQKSNLKFTDVFKHPYSAIAGLIEERYERKAIFEKNVRRVVINSTYSRDTLVRDYQFPPDIVKKIEVLPRGYDIDRFKIGNRTKSVCQRDVFDFLGLNGKNRYPILLFVGGIAQHKGQFELIEGLPSIKRVFPETVLILVGKDSGNEVACRQKISELNLEKSVFIIASPLDEMLGKIFKATDIYVSAAGEGFGINQAEAMAMGLPMVAWDKGAIKELFADGEEGFLVNSRNSFTDKVILLAGDKALQGKIGEKAQKRALKDYNWRVMTEAIEKDVLEIASEFYSSEA